MEKPLNNNKETYAEKRKRHIHKKLTPQVIPKTFADKDKQPRGPLRNKRWDSEKHNIPHRPRQNNKRKE